MLKVLVVGSVPPPYDGQSIAFESAVIALESAHTVSKVSTSFRSKNFMKSILLALRYFSNIWKSRLFFKPDVIYFVCSRTTVGSIRDLFLLFSYRASGVTIVNHIHGSNFKCFLNSLSPVYKFFFLAGYSRVDKHIVLTERMKDQVRDIDKSGEKISVISNYYGDIAGLSDIDINKSEYNPGPIRLVYLSSICESKGIFDVIKASKKLASLKIKHTLKIAGMGIDDSVSNAAYSMNRLQKNVANNEAISYLGLVTGLEKYELLSRSHIFILPSYYSSEAIPLSIIEAMRMGCVIITTNFRYLPDLVKNNINGYLVRVKNSTDIVNIVMDIFNDKDQFEIISKYNISYAKKYYSEDRYRLNIIKQVSNDCSI